MAAQAVATVNCDVLQTAATKTFRLSNTRTAMTLTFVDGILQSELLESAAAGPADSRPVRSRLESDGDFRLQVVWTDWLAPGKMNNGDNPVILNKRDFRWQLYKIREESAGAKEIEFVLDGVNQKLELKIIYRLEPDKFYVRRKLALRDAETGGHFLEKIVIWSGSRRVLQPPAVQQAPKARIEGSSEAVAMEQVNDGSQGQEKPVLVKSGGFGQPVALTAGQAGAFWGLEYPAAHNQVAAKSGDSVEVSCWQDFGRKIEADWLESAWLVMALTPDPYVKKWFFDYLDDIRVAPLRPYTLYNSWYDLRSAEYPRVPEANVMNEINVRRMINLVRENMIEKHGIKLDAFVLDDGWDVYESDWALRSAQFPNGLRSIATELAKTGTALGLWFGPAGGYSFRMKRIDWMKAHGYEVVGQGKNRAMLCLGGKNYSQLFAKRTADLVDDAGVGYFKWDGVQFSCSEPDHGHPIGIFSGPAILNSLIEKCRNVRQKKNDIFLNITSGTWLSPWWLKYANTIWMDGADYAFAGVPSPTGRDGAMTYRDYVLYDDFHNKGLWFPIANLMTHGIIKGKLESISNNEPLEKFTDDVLLYFARGVSMYELYISPDILSPGEWNAISLGLRWARDRFPILSHSEMIGGDPARAETYGFVHFTGKKGIIAARNPGSNGSSLEATLDPAYGLDTDAASLVVEQVYPIRRVWPQLFSAGGRLTIPLDAFETAIYEIYPLSEAAGPLLAGITCNHEAAGGMEIMASFSDPAGDVRLLNPEIVREIRVQDRVLAVSDLGKLFPQAPPALTDVLFKGRGGRKHARVETAFSVDPSVSQAQLAILLSQDAAVGGKVFPEVEIRINGKKITPAVEKQDGAYSWFMIEIPAGRHRVVIQAKPAPGQRRWSGNLTAWANIRQRAAAVEIVFALNKPAPPRILPPAAGGARRSIKLGQQKLEFDK